MCTYIFFLFLILFEEYAEEEKYPNLIFYILFLFLRVTVEC